MFTPGNLLLFTPFKFKNGAPPKDKFFLVLRVSTDGQAVVAPLPTSVNRQPSLVDKTHGCINIEERCHNCYIYEPGKVICVSGFCFSKPTFIYSNDIEDFPIANLTVDYPTAGQDYQVKGELLPNELQDLLDCIKNSGSVKRKIKRMLFG